MSIPRFILRYVWWFRITWREVNGRWWIFRDAPDWFCWEALYTAEGAPERDGLQRIGAEAAAELELRINNIRREFERKLAGAMKEQS